MIHANGTLEVSGTGSINVAPDEARVSLSINTEGKTANEAAAANAKRTQAVIDAVSAQPNHGVTTSGLHLSPIVDYTTSPYRIVGYQASNSVNVKTKIGYAGTIFDTGIGAGANESSGIAFVLQNERPFREEALALAVKFASTEAHLVATAADVKLAGLQAISITPSGGQIIRRMGAIDKNAAATPVLPEDLTVSATVRLVFNTRA